jgi:LmbE family N-acetylglucosaminyl deacetylase
MLVSCFEESKNMKIVFLQPHPDDLEFNCGQIMHFLAKESPKKHIIKIASATKGEYGLPGAQYDKFKGDFLAKIRVRELNEAQAIHGIPPENITFFNFIDGFVPFNMKFVKIVVDYLNSEHPDVIFAPEPIYTWYWHMDHINCGRAVYYAIHHKLINFVPKVYYYQTIASNWYFPFERSAFKLNAQLLSKHRTQQWLVRSMKIMYIPLISYAGLKLRGSVHHFRYAEAYRRAYFGQGSKKRNTPGIISRIFAHFFSSMPWFKAKYPQNILDDIKRRQKVLK